MEKGVRLVMTRNHNLVVKVEKCRKKRKRDFKREKGGKKPLYLDPPRWRQCVKSYYRRLKKEKQRGDYYESHFS
jgi:hypothetical protein